MLKDIELPQHYNYVGAFLSLACNLSCSYCINHLVGLNQSRRHLDAGEWAQALNRIYSKNNVPISLQGGEPSIHKGFIQLLNGLRSDLNVDLLTNLQFDPHLFMKLVKRERFERDLPYPAIRVSYHPETMSLQETVKKVKVLHDNGYSIGLFSVAHPDVSDEIKRASELCEKAGIFFKTKELLGMHDGKLHGTYHYPDAVFSKTLKTVQCKTSELLLSPEGDIFRCHHDLYNKKNPIGHILDKDFQIEDIFRECKYYGNCNPCDVKRKNNRYQEFGHCSVEVIH